MIVAIIQARANSKRFPRKIFANLSGKPLIWHVVNRLKFSRKVNRIVLATTNNYKDNELAKWAEYEGVTVYRGSEEDVLKRFYFAASESLADIIVRITADDPFKDPNIIDHVIDKLLEEELDFAYNNSPATFPEGLDTEVFKFESLERAYLNSIDTYEREHVTPYFYRNKTQFKQGNYFNNINLSSFRWTIDTELDYEMASKVYDILYEDNKIFLMDDILNLLKELPEISQINNAVDRSDMYK